MNGIEKPAVIGIARQDLKAIEVLALENPTAAIGLRSQWVQDHAETLLRIAESASLSVSIPDKAQDAARD
jgi:hypothetical protein